MKKQVTFLLGLLFNIATLYGQFTLATDNADNYSGTWSNGNNYGTGYNAWSITYGSNTGTFIGNPSNDGMGTSGIGTTAFGLYATGSQYVNANRQMSNAMEFNDKFSFYWAMNWDANGGNKGFDIKAGGSTVFNVNNSGSATITSTAGDVDNTYGTNPMFVEIVRTGNTSYSFSMTKRSSGTFSATFTSSNAVNEIGIYIGNQNNGAGQRNIYFNHFQVTNDGNFNTGSDSYTYTKALTGTGALTKSGSGTLTLTGENTYSGTTIVNGGTLRLNRSGGGTLASTNNVTVNSGGTLRISTNQTLNNLTINSGGDLIVDAGTTLTINGALTINESVTIAGNLTIATGGAAEIAAGKALTVSGTLSNSGTLTLTSNASGTGSLIHNTSGVSATVERYVAGDWSAADAGWHLISSPVASQAISAFETTGGGNGYDFYGWRESDKLWLNYKAGDFSTWNGGTNFVVGRGYLISYEANQTKSFSGNLNVSDVSVSGLSYTPAQGNGWHLLGNPFASALEWNNGSWSLTNVAGTAKIWNSGSKSYTDINANGIIPSAQGFFVQVNNATNSLTIPASARIHSSTAWYKASDVPMLKLIARPTDGSSAQENILRMEPEATAGYDFYWDSQFLPGSAPKLYSLADGVKLSTNALPAIEESTEIPLGFEKNDRSNFSIELAENTLPAIVLLKDLKLGITHNLTQQPVYTFTSVEGDNANRFKLAFASVGIAPEQQNPVPHAWYANGMLHFRNVESGSLVEVYSSHGHKVVSERLQGNTLSLQVAPGVYMLKISGAQQQNIQKVVIY